MGRKTRLAVMQAVSELSILESCQAGWIEVGAGRGTDDGPADQDWA